MPVSVLARGETLRSLFVLDTEPELVLDAIARFAAELCHTPMAFIDLVEEEQRWFRPDCGLHGLGESARQLLQLALGQELLQIRDAAIDARTADNPLVTGHPNIRFYAGMPVTLADGSLLGSLCVLDTEPRELNPEQGRALQALATIVAGIIEKRRLQYAEELEQLDPAAPAEAHPARPLNAVLDGMKSMVALWGTDFRIRFANQEFAAWFGTAAEQLAGLHLSELIGAAAYRDSRPYIEKALAGKVQVFEHELPGLDEQSRPVMLRFVPYQSEAGVIGGFFSVVAAVDDSPEEVSTESDERYRQVLEASQMGIWFFDPAAETFTFDELSRAHHGLVEQTISAERMLAITHADDRARVRKIWMAHEQPPGGASPEYGFELRVRHPSGRYVWLAVAARAHYGGDDGGRAVLITGTSRDISEPRRLQESLRREHERLRVTLESIGDAVITTDRGGRVQYMNPVAEILSGCHQSEALGTALEQVVGRGNEQSIRLGRELVRRCLREDRMLAFTEPALVKTPFGGESWVQCSLAPIRDPVSRTVGAVIILRDVTEQRRQAEQALYRSTHDPLTDLYNRKEFERRLADLIEATRKQEAEHCVLMIDLDNFKLVNDASGHQIGDRVLQDVSRLLEQCIRTGDTLARFGGDEFAIILHRCGLESATVVARKICARVEDFVFMHEGQNFRIGTSIGLALLDHHCKSLTDILKEVDSACYVAKKAGGARVQAYVERDIRLKRHKTVVNWATRLVNAIDQGSFELFGQLITPSSGRASGLHCEVLLRLSDEQGQLTGPGVFMPAAERYHIASRIDRWVVKRVFDLLDDPEVNMDALEMISINLSGQSLGDQEFHRYIDHLMTATRFDLRKICFEITETSAVANLEDARIFIERMSAHGIRFALDDFGSGFSSFAYLKKLPVDFIKIDGQFVRNMVTDAVDALTVKCITEIGQGLGRRTIAEFVETEEVRAALEALGVDMVQGYLLHMPEPLMDILRRHQGLHGAGADPLRVLAAAG